jgi:hypothetical protein
MKASGSTVTTTLDINRILKHNNTKERNNVDRKTLRYLYLYVAAHNSFFGTGVSHILGNLAGTGSCIPYQGLNFGSFNSNLKEKCRVSISSIIVSRLKNIP